MSTLSQFAGGAATTSIVNFYSSGGVQSSAVINAAAAGGAREVLSGALTAATLATALTVTGGGEIPALSVYTKDTTSRTVQIRVTVDGVVVFDATSSAVTVVNNGLIVVGFQNGSAGLTPSAAPIRFNTSLTVQIASSLTETDKVAIGYILNKR
jgi:hypothetical protein